jgi:hypothetical protein
MELPVLIDIPFDELTEKMENLKESLEKKLNGEDDGTNILP